MSGHDIKIDLLKELQSKNSLISEKINLSCADFIQSG